MNAGTAARGRQDDSGYGGSQQARGIERRGVERNGVGKVLLAHHLDRDVDLFEIK